TLDLYSQIDHLHPCGIENPDPVFWTPNVRIVEQQTIGQNRAHLKVTVTQDQPSPASGASDNIPASPTIKAIAWRWGEYCPLPTRIDIAYRLRLNEWNGERNVELEIVGVRPSLGESPLANPAANARASVRQSPAEQPLPATAQRPENPLAQNQAAQNQAAQNQAAQRTDFWHNDRPYSCSVSQNGDGPELRIRNSEGQVLAIQPQQRQGLLGKRRDEAKPVDISQPHYATLIRTAMQALNIDAENFL
ncbi:MAG TPA: hypothetical protein V6C88_00800, partial [Chroococcidiopsis sp.]